MKITREELHVMAAKLTQDESRKSARMADIVPVFSDYIGTTFAKFSAYVDEPHSEDEITAAMKPVVSAVNLYNDARRYERLDTLLSMKPKTAMADYLKNQCVKGMRFTSKLDKSTNEMVYSVKPCDTVELDAYDFVSTICSTELNGITDAVCIFADNLARFTFAEEEAHISRKSMHASYIAMRERKGWNTPIKQLSKNKLAAQLTEVCNMISFGTAPKMLSTDVKYIIHGVIQSKTAANKGGTIQMRDEKTIIRYVFRAMYTRVNNLAYEFQTQTRAESAPLTYKASVAENPKAPEFQPTEEPAAGAVTVGTATTQAATPAA